MMKPNGALISVFRSLTLVLVIAGLAGATAMTASMQRASAQEGTTAAIVEGSCDSPGESVADLRELSAAEGGALTSFTTVDLALDDLTGGEFAVVVGDPGDPSACGEVTGEGSDVYIVIHAQGDAALGGVAWLRARDQRTQISLFIGEGLGGTSTSSNGSNGGDDDGPPEPPVDETPETDETPEPEPPVDETPEPEPPVDETPEPSGNEETYTAPTYGYSLTYDAEFWEVTEDSTFPTDSGPADYFVLYNGADVVQVELVGLAGVEINAQQYIANWVSGFLSDQSYIATSVRLDDEGNEIRGGDAQRAFVALDFEAQSSQGSGTYKNTYFIVAWQMGPPDELVVMIFQTGQNEYDEYVPYREALEAGMSFPE